MNTLSGINPQTAFAFLYYGASCSIAEWPFFVFAAAAPYNDWSLHWHLRQRITHVFVSATKVQNIGRPNAHSYFAYFRRPY